MKNILFVAAHADDIELGCGGTLNRFRDDGHKIRVLCFSANRNLWPEQKDEWEKAMEVFEIEKQNLVQYDMHSCTLEDFRHKIYMELECHRNVFKPTMVFVHSSFDTNQDHQTVYRETVRVFKKHASIFGYEFPNNNLKFDYGMFVNLGEQHIQKKIDALRCYKSQMSDKLVTHNYMDERNIRALAIVRGQQIMAEYAECFEVIREII